MVRQNVRIKFPPTLVTEPIVYQLSKQFEIATNIQRANVTKDEGWVILELQGPEEDVQRAIGWARDRGVTVELLPESLQG
jgi:ABC-type methionine transport system ATPase subunit